MKLGIMQPYFFPYIGYFQLLNAVDKFVVYDNIQYSKKGWINRNRVLNNGVETYITLPLKKDSDYLDVKDRKLADSWGNEKKKMVSRISEYYKKAPYFQYSFPIIKEAILYEEYDLFKFILNSIELLKKYLGIETPLIISSSLSIEHNLKGQEKVIEICKEINAQTYINPIGGQELYSKEHFNKENINLFFLKTQNVVYPQFENSFIPFLSIIDVMMFNSKDHLKEYLNTSYSLL